VAGRLPAPISSFAIWWQAEENRKRGRVITRASTAFPDIGGGGFGALVLPSGAYVVKGEQVRWVPAVDLTIVVLAALSLVRLLARTKTRHRGRGLIPVTLGEVRRLLAHLTAQPPARSAALAWSQWRRRHQHRAKISHYQRRQADYN
jgi:hypothetical protein